MKVCKGNYRLVGKPVIEHIPKNPKKRSREEANIAKQQEDAKIKRR
jgi:hypothetical protein